MLRRVLLVVAFTTLIAPGVSEGAITTQQLVDGVTYARELRWTGAGPVVVHILRAPKPGGLHALRPVLANGVVTGRETVSSMQRRFARTATVGGVNGDFFNLRTGHPSGIFMRGGVVRNRPQPRRSSLGIGSDGLLRIGRVRFFGAWKIGDGALHPLGELNRPLRTRKVGLFTSAWGARTPPNRYALEVHLARFRARPNRDLHATVLKVRRGGARLIPPGGAVLQARGPWRRVLRTARAGDSMTLQLRLRPWWEGVADAIGGGPVLVRDGRPIARAGEEFTWDQLAGRHPRTAVGQLANGRIALVAVDGRWSGSVGLRTWELALLMARLGAVNAMSLDGGGSTTMAFNGRVLNRPSGGAERSVVDGLMVFYYGIYAPKPRRPVISPNGDGVIDSQVLAAKLVRRSQVDLRLLRPDGTVHWRFSGTAGRGVRTKVVGRGMREGRWRWVVDAVDGGGLASRMVRSFVVNRTLGFLRLSKQRMIVYPRRGGRLVASFNLTNPSGVTVTVLNGQGRAVRLLASQSSVQPARVAVLWDGRRSNGTVVGSGSYTIRITARNGLGRVSLERSVHVRRVRRGR